MKWIIITLSLFIAILLIGYWYNFIKAVPITNERMLHLCINNHQLKINTTESAKYFTDFMAHSSNDTLYISISTTTILNPFASKEWYKVIDINPVIRYINITGETIALAGINNCEGPSLNK